MQKPHLTLILFAAAFAAVPTALNRAVGYGNLPYYATWTGVATLEEKLRLYKAFARQGPVDLVLFGSSLVDHGVSAEILSRDLTAAYGKPYRVFNCSTGAGDHKTFPVVYRLLRTVSTPRGLLYLYPGGRGTGESVHPRTPEGVMRTAPVGNALSHQFLLNFSSLFWNQPFVAKAGAMRDLFINGKYVNRPASHLDSYRISYYGDTLSYLFNQDPALSDAMDIQQHESILQGARDCTARNAGAEACWDLFLSHADRDALRAVRAMTTADRTSIGVMWHDRALGYAAATPNYLKAVSLNLSVIARTLGASRVFVSGGFVPRPYEYADDQHLNRNGAIRLTHRMAAILSNRAPSDQPECAFPTIAERKDPSINPLTAVVLRPPGSWSRLHLRYMLNSLFPPLLPNYPTVISLLTPDGKTVESIAAAQADGSFIAEYPRLPQACQAYVVRIQAKVESDRRPYLLPLTAAWWSN